MPIDLKNVGQGRTFPEVVQQYDSSYGTFHDSVYDHAMVDRVPNKELPTVNIPTPFGLGPMTPGGR
jgi:hypothetical protein